MTDKEQEQIKALVELAAGGPGASARARQKAIEQLRSRGVLVNKPGPLELEPTADTTIHQDADGTLRIRGTGVHEVFPKADAT